MEETIRNCLSAARQASRVCNYSSAFKYYIAAFENINGCEKKNMLQAEFQYVFTKYNEGLATSLNVDEIFSNFKIAMKIFPHSYHFINELGKYLFKFGFHMEAMQHFYKVLKLDPGNVNAEKNMNSVKSFLVERWHFRMLNDKVRNEAYSQALKETLSSRDSVLDIGTGTGLLALYASESKPSSICGCDCSSTMTNLAQKVLEENAQQEVNIVTSMSQELSSKLIRGRKSVLVTELFDAGLFGEHILQTIAHAKKYLLQKSAKIIANKAEFFIVGAKCDRINMKYQLTAQAKMLINLPNSHIHVSANDGEPYDCDDVHHYKDLVYMTEPQSLTKINFNDEDDIITFLENDKQLSVQLKAIKSGEVNVWIGYFNLHLTETVSITTNPQQDSRANAWQQAIFYNHIPITVERDQTIDLDFVMGESKLYMVPNNSNPIITISAETLRFLNDSQYINQITKCLEAASLHLRTVAEITEIRIIDLCPFPVFGLLMLQRGAHSVTCCAKTVEDREFLKTVMKANNIPEHKLRILPSSDLYEEIFNDGKYHAIFCNILELGGDIDIHMKNMSRILKQNHLVQNGLYMPAKVTLYGQIVKSHWLDINNRVYNENVSNYNIAKYMNKYQVSQNIDIDLSCLEYTAVSGPVNLGEVTEIPSDVIDVPIHVDSAANAIICWYSIELIKNMGEISTKVSNSFINSTAFLADPEEELSKGDAANILRCVDKDDGSFKLLLDVE